MGRRPSIDREGLLDAAERVVLRSGAAQLTIDAVAAEAGVSKGGVLYSFPSKDALIDALYRRVIAQFTEIGDRVIAELGDSPQTRIRAHVTANLEHEEGVSGRIISLIVNYMRSPEARAESQIYYRGLLEALDTTTPLGKRLRLALLAAEGAFLLRGFDFHPLSAEEWQEIHQDIMSILLD